MNVLLDHTNFVNHAEDGDANIGVDYDKDVESTYALRNIKKGEELTMRYDSMNWRTAMKEVKGIVGELKGVHNKPDYEKN